MKLIEPHLAARIIIWGGWALALIGALKVVFYLIGEIRPGIYARIQSAGVRRFLTGTGNRLVFGLGGLLTVILGLVFAALGYGIRYLADRL